MTLPNESPTAPRDDAALVPEATARERPILFSGPMVRALLDGRKTQTRRVVKLPTWADSFDGSWVDRGLGGGGYLKVPHRDGEAAAGVHRHRCPYGDIGDRLWVRETFRVFEGRRSTEWIGAEWDSYNDRMPATGREREIAWEFAADGLDDDETCRWRPSIHMPRYVSRLTLELTDVRVERLQDISEDDAIDEGMPYEWHGVPVGAVENYRPLWDSLNAKRGAGWDVNPWVLVLTFRREPSDAPAADAAGRADR